MWFGKSFINFVRAFINLLKLVHTRTCSRPGLDSGIAFGSDCQITGRGSNLTQTCTLPPDQQNVVVVSAPKFLNKLCQHGGTQ